jgi:hypothetical protein
MKANSLPAAIRVVYDDYNGLTIILVRCQEKPAPFHAGRQNLPAALRRIWQCYRQTPRKTFYLTSTRHHLRDVEKMNMPILIFKKRR